MSLPENYKYKKIPNAAYFCGLALYKEVQHLWVDYDQLVMSQEHIDVDHAERLRNVPHVRDVPGIAVKLDDYTFVMDGHHRAYAAYLRGDKRVYLRVVDLNEYFTTRCERFKGKKKVGLNEIKAQDLEDIGLL